MYDPLRRRMLAILKVPPEPHAPMGDPASLQIFRAGRNYYRLRMASWVVAQLLALAGILFWTAILIDVESMTQSQRTVTTSGLASTPTGQLAGSSSESPRTDRRRKNRGDNFAEKLKSAAEAKGGGWAGFKQVFVEIALILPVWSFSAIWAFKIFGFTVYLLQIPMTYAVRRLDYEMRWYMVTDRSLRLRHGVWKISETTMSFANLQQVEVTQGPLQRLLGMGDVKVQSAGGGSGGGEHSKPGDDMHHGLFHSVTNASEIRDLILERLRHFRESGLGNPDEKPTSPAMPAAASSQVPTADIIAAAREFSAEAKALRLALS